MRVKRNWNATHDTSRWALLVVIPLVVLVHLVAQSLAADTAESKKMKRQVAIMEQVLDQVLVESPNFLVPGRDNTRGIYLPEFGALFTFEASLISKDWDFGSMGGHGFKYETDKDGKHTIIWSEDDEHSEEEADSEESEEEAEEDHESKSEKIKSKEAAQRLKKKLGDQEDLYERGKKEIQDVLLEYGDTMTGLRDDQWVAIAGFLKDSKFFAENKLSRLVMRARMKDLRAYTSGQITEQAMITKVVQEEY